VETGARLPLFSPRACVNERWACVRSRTVPAVAAREKRGRAVSCGIGVGLGVRASQGGRSALSPRGGA